VYSSIVVALDVEIVGTVPDHPDRESWIFAEENAVAVPVNSYTLELASVTRMCCPEYALSHVSLCVALKK